MAYPNGHQYPYSAQYHPYSYTPTTSANHTSTSISTPSYSTQSRELDSAYRRELASQYRQYNKQLSTASSGTSSSQPNGSYATSGISTLPQMNGAVANNASRPATGPGLNDQDYRQLASRTNMEVSQLRSFLNNQNNISSMTRTVIVHILRYLREINRYGGALTGNKPKLVQALQETLYSSASRAAVPPSHVAGGGAQAAAPSTQAKVIKPAPHLRAHFDSQLKKSPFFANYKEAVCQTVYSSQSWQQQAGLHSAVFNVPMVNFERLFENEQTYDASRMKHALLLALATPQGTPIHADAIKNNLLEIKIAGRPIRWDPSRMKKDDQVIDITGYLHLQNIHDHIVRGGKSSPASFVQVYIKGQKYQIDRGFVLMNIVDKLSAYDLAAQVYINTCGQLGLYWEHRSTVIKMATGKERVNYLAKVISDNAAAMDVMNQSTVKKDDDDDEITIGDQQISLNCPLSMTRIVHPAKSSVCNHRECFDLISFLQVNERNKLWKCGVCGKEVKLNSLVVDRLFMAWLSKYTRDDRIVLHADGTTSSHRPVVEDLEDEDRGAKRRRADSTDSDHAPKQIKIKEEDTEGYGNGYAVMNGEGDASINNIESDDEILTPQRRRQMNGLSRRLTNGQESSPLSTPGRNGWRPSVPDSAQSVASSSRGSMHEVRIEKGDDGRQREVIVLDDDD